MKLSDIITIKKGVDKLPPHVASWVLTITTIISLVSFYFGAKFLIGNFIDDKRSSQIIDERLIKNDSSMNIKLGQILISLDTSNAINRRMHSLQDMKMNAIISHINRLENKNGALLRDIKQIDSMSRLFPFQFYMGIPPEKKNSLILDVLFQNSISNGTN